MKKIFTRKNFLFLFSWMFSAISAFGAGDFPLTATIPAGQNYVHLSWDPSALPGYIPGKYNYTVKISGDNGASWQTCSANYGKKIKVLNVFPDIAGSNQLKTWMGTTETDPGMGLIAVDPIAIASFNANPDSYLKDAEGNYQYDVIMFGTWDCNYSRDLSVAARDAVEAFLKTGRGVLLGHDTSSNMNQGTCGAPHVNFNYLVNTYLNESTPSVGSYLAGSSTVKAVNDGFLLKYPWDLSARTSFTIPYTHPLGQIANGIIWMKFDIATTDNRNFYLTTWNNMAQIQTGHSNASATLDEQKIIANTLIYLAQFTQATSADAHCAMDVAAPDKPTAVRTACKTISIQSKDNGTANQFHVMATDIGDQTRTYHSDTISATPKAGLAGYFISEDHDPNGQPVIIRDGMGHVIVNPTVTTKDNQLITYTPLTNATYIHIQAVDSAGNLSALSSTISPVISVNVSTRNISNCIGETAALTADGTATSFTWSPAEGLNTTTGKNVNATRSAAGIYKYYVTGTDAMGCTAKDSAIVLSGHVVCAGSSNVPVSLSDNWGTITKWQYAFSPFTTWTDINETAGTLIVENLPETAKIRAIVNGSTPTDAVTIKTFPKPVVSITGATGICIGSTSQLSPTSGGTWVSNNPSVATVTNAGVVTGISAGSVTFTYTRPDGCSSSLTIP